MQDLRERLDARRQELEQTALTRIAEIADPAQVPDPSYVVGLRAALAAALDYGLSSVASGGERLPPIPVALLAQARMAARTGVSLQTVLRRYAAGHSLLSDGLLEEAATAGIGTAELKSALRDLTRRYDRIVAAVSEEYGREAAAQPLGAERRRYALVRRLLAGEPVEASELDYPLDGHHVAVVAAGPSSPDALGRLGQQIDRRLLLVLPDERSTWAWLGGRRPFEEDELAVLAAFHWPEDCFLAGGEPAEGASGWCLSHRQAAAALPVAEQAAAGLVHYTDVALLASALQDNLLATSLRRRYLAPLQESRDGGKAAKQTLRAYFAAAGNLSSAAAAIGVNRRTVASRISAIEDRFGRTLDSIAAELEVALRLDEVERLT